ncbi:MAG: hypothetical protein MR691_04395 [Clostridium sp.]|nr:hypothetical protein [Clostridium sp.]DAJ61640.1 MAG TPA: hypothetical protein [Caudoviricetes sp.]
MILTKEEIDTLIITKKRYAEMLLLSIMSEDLKENYTKQKAIMADWFIIINRIEELIDYKIKIEKEEH